MKLSIVYDIEKQQTVYTFEIPDEDLLHLKLDPIEHAALKSKAETLADYAQDLAIICFRYAQAQQVQRIKFKVKANE